eukprot:3934268-Rhodomonas_salina.1
MSHRTHTDSVQRQATPRGDAAKSNTIRGLRGAHGTEMWRNGFECAAQAADELQVLTLLRPRYLHPARQAVCTPPFPSFFFFFQHVNAPPSPFFFVFLFDLLGGGGAGISCWGRGSHLRRGAFAL